MGAMNGACVTPVLMMRGKEGRGRGKEGGAAVIGRDFKKPTDGRVCFRRGRQQVTVWRWSCPFELESVEYDARLMLEVLDAFCISLQSLEIGGLACVLTRLMYILWQHPAAQYRPDL